MNVGNSILAAVRRRLNRRQALEASLEVGLDRRMRESTPGPQPLWEEEPVARFVAKSEAVHATVGWARDTQSIPQSVLEHLDQQDLAHKLVAAPHPLLTGLAWPEGMGLAWRRAEEGDEVGLSVAYAGIAESGTLAMVSAPDSPASINFLPSLHLVILRRERILRQQEDLWALLAAESEPMPRALNLITGPSKTGDVEQTIVYGAHGPGRLHILITG